MLSLVLLAGSASAAVYKWVDEQGNVHYGDLPPGQLPAEAMKLPGISTYQHREVPAQPKPAAPAPKAFAGYTKIEIVQPEANAAVRANDQKVMVALVLEPALQEGHQVVYLLDGQAVGEPDPSPAVELSGVARGQHTVQARVLDAAGKQLAQSQRVVFTLRKATIIKPKVTPPPAKPTTP